MTASSAFASWQATAHSAGLSEEQSDAIFTVLSERYAVPNRAYHNLQHIVRMLDTVTPFQPIVHDYPALCLAIWFHDVMYDTRRSDNEEQSAALMANLLRPALTEAVLDRVQTLIQATKTHQADSADTDCQLLIDADLAILGSSPADYDAYARAIREEYAWVSDADYRAGRRRVLEHFLARPRLYQTDDLFVLWEQPARDNLRREIGYLA